MMPPHLLLLALLIVGQSPGATPAAMPPAGPLPDYARPVHRMGVDVIPPDPVLGCIHRTADLPFDPSRIDEAALRILQLTRWSELRNARSLASLDAPSPKAPAVIPMRPPSAEQRRQLRELDRAIGEHWSLFEARVAEVRMFQHRAAEGRLACRRAADAWDALLALLGRHPAEPPPDLIDEFSAVDGWVGVLRAASAPGP